MKKQAEKRIKTRLIDFKFAKDTKSYSENTKSYSENTKSPNILPKKSQVGIMYDKILVPPKPIGFTFEKYHDAKYRETILHSTTPFIDNCVSTWTNVDGEKKIEIMSDKLKRKKQIFYIENDNLYEIPWDKWKIIHCKKFKNDVCLKIKTDLVKEELIFAGFFYLENSGPEFIKGSLMD